NDTVTVDWSTGNFNKDIQFNGGGNSGDILNITDGSFSTATMNFFGPHNGALIMDPTGPAPAVTVNYTGLAPVDVSDSSIDDLVFNLPAGPSAAVLEDDGSSGNSDSQLRSTNNSFEKTIFANPINSLTVNAGNGNDSMTIAALPDFDRSLTIGTSASAF